MSLLGSSTYTRDKSQINQNAELLSVHWISEMDRQLFKISRSIFLWSMSDFDITECTTLCKPGGHSFWVRNDRSCSRKGISSYQMTFW